MKVSADHFLEDVRRDILPGGQAMPTRRLLVIHFTAGMSGQSSIDYWRKELGGKICAHLVIDRDGTITQCRGFDRTCGHAGISRWRDPQTGILYGTANGYSIGIELANAGDSVREFSGVPKAFGKYPLPAGALRARHKNGGPETFWERYPQPQLAACTFAATALVARYKLDDVCGHEDIAPERKNDPGPAFPMQQLREACGFTGLPRVHRA